jgi:hypothetical protein
VRRALPWLVACLVVGELCLSAPGAQGQIFGRRAGRTASKPASTKPEVSVKVDRSSITTDDQLSVEVRLSGEFDRYQEPDFTGFEVENQGSSQQIQVINGRMSAEKIMTFLLIPRRAGVLTIGAARIFNGGQEVAASAPIRIRVTGAKAPEPTTAQAAKDVTSRSARESVFIQVDTERTSYYVGEPFVITWRLFYRRDVGVQGLEHVSEPRLEGLLAEELLPRDHKPRPKERRIGGTRFRFFDHSKRLATGLAPGRVTIDSVSVRYIAGTLFRKNRSTVRSKPFDLEIKQLPSKGRPEAFRPGNIGRFMFKASLRNADGVEPKRVQTGERLIMDVTLSGRGALLGVQPPVIAESETFDVELMPGQSDDELLKDEDGMRGKRVFQYIVTGTKPGKSRTPEVRFAFFDPSREAYQTHRWPGVALEVSGRAVGSAQDSDALVDDDIRPNAPTQELTDYAPLQPLKTAWFWLLLGLPLLGVTGLELRHRVVAALGANPDKRRARGAHGKALKRLVLAEAAAKQGLVQDFYGQLDRSLAGYLEERVNVPVQGMTHDELRTACLEAGYGDALVQRLIDERDNCDFARFAPTSNVDASMKEAAQRVRELLAALNRVSPRRRP